MEEPTYYHSDNYRVKYNTDEFYTYIMDAVSQKMNRPLSQGEQTQTISFIKRVDPDLLIPAYVNKTIPIMVKTLAKGFGYYICDKPQDIDSQQILRDTIGISSESGTTHSIYDNPEFALRRLQEREMQLHKEQKELRELELPTAQLEQDIIKQQEIQKEQDLLEHTAIKTSIYNPTSSSTDINNVRSIIPIKSNITPKTISNISNLLGMQNADEAVRALNPDSINRKNYILLDSRYRIITDFQQEFITQFSWAYVMKTQEATQGTVNLIGNVRDINALRVYPFRIPYVADADNKYARISVFIEEFGSQAFIAHEHRKFHFMLRSTIDGEFIELETNKFNDGFFFFEKPITNVNSLTVTFGSPLEPIVFERDRDYCSINYFIIAPLTQFTTENPHNLVNGDRVYFSQFRVGEVNPLLPDQVAINQNILDGINREEGFLVTVIDNLNFSINFDSSLIQNPIPNTTDPPPVPPDALRIEVFYGSKRFFMPLEIQYVMPEPGSET